MPLPDAFGNLVAALADLLQRVGTDPVLLQEPGRAVGRLNVEPQVVEPPDQRQRLVLIPVGDRRQHRSVVLQPRSPGLQRLVQRPVQLVVIADGLARGFHFRAQIGVQSLDLVKAEHRYLHIEPLLLLRIQVEDPLLLQALPQNHLRGDVRQGIPRRLAQERHRPAGPRIHFNNIYILIGVHDELDVIKPDDPDPEAQLLRVLQDDPLHLVTDGKRRINGDGVAAVDARPLHQFHNPGHEHVPPVADRIHLDLFAPDVFVHQHRLVRVDLHRGFQVMPQLLLVGHNLHRPAAQHEARPHQHRIPDLLRRPHAVFDFCHGLPLRLRNPKVQQNLLKAVPVLRPLDGRAVRPDDLHAPVHQRLGQVDGCLSAEGGDYALRLFKVDDRHHVFRRQRLKVQLVRGSVVRRNRLRVVVDDNGFISGPPDGLHRMHRGVVELHALPDADRSGPQHDNLLFVRQDRIVHVAVAGIKVSDVFPGVQRIHHPENRHDALFLPQPVNLRLLHAPQLRDVLVPEAHLLCFPKQLRVAPPCSQLFLHVRDFLQAFEEKLRNHRPFVDLVNPDPPAQQFANRVKRIRPEFLHVFQQGFGTLVIKLGQLKMAHSGLQAPHALQHAFLQVAPDAHHFARSLHLGPQGIAGRCKLIKGEPRELRDNVVQARFHRRVSSGHRNLFQCHAHRDLRRHPRNRIPAGLAGQGGRTAHPGIDLDQEVLAAVRVQGELYVAAAFNLQFPDDLDGAVVQHLQVVVVQAQNRRHHHAVAGMHAHGVHVLHPADRDRLVVAVPHDLEFDLLVSADTLFDQHLVHRAQPEGVRPDFNQFFLVVGKSAAGAAQGEGRTQNHRVPDIQGRLLRLFQVVGNLAGDYGLADALAHFLEQFPVLRPLDAPARGPQQLRSAFLQHALAFQLHGQVQARLSADAGHDGVRPLVPEDLRDVLQRQRLHINLICNGSIRHDRRRIRVAQHHLVSLFLQGQTGLRACVVKFRRLPDHDGTAPDNQNLFNIRPLCHEKSPSLSFLKPAIAVNKVAKRL